MEILKSSFRSNLKEGDSIKVASFLNRNVGSNSHSLGYSRLAFYYYSLSATCTKTYDTNLRIAYDDMGLPVEERAPEEFQIQASNWKEALLKRFEQEPEHRFEARIREVKRDGIGYSITTEFGMLYVDMYKLDTEEILGNKLFNSVKELTNYLKEGY